MCVYIISPDTSTPVVIHFTNTSTFRHTGLEALKYSHIQLFASEDRLFFGPPNKVLNIGPLLWDGLLHDNMRDVHHHSDAGLGGVFRVMLFNIDAILSPLSGNSHMLGLVPALTGTLHFEFMFCMINQHLDDR